MNVIRKPRKTCDFAAIGFGGAFVYGGAAYIRTETTFTATGGVRNAVRMGNGEYFALTPQTQVEPLIGSFVEE